MSDSELATLLKRATMRVVVLRRLLREAEDELKAALQQAEQGQPHAA